MFSDTVTIYNIYRNFEDDSTTYFRSVIDGVHCQSKFIHKLNDREIESASYLEIYIPLTAHERQYKDFMEEKEWNFTQDKQRAYTFQSEDIVIVGYTDFEITDSKSVNEVFEKHKAFRITGFNPYGFGSIADHAKVVAK